MAKNEASSLRDSIAALARSHRYRRVEIDWLWNAFLKKHTELDALERRGLFLTALQSWSTAGGCRLPRRRADWRNDAVPPLPSWVHVIAPKVENAEASERVLARSRQWVPLMQFMANRATVPDLSTAMALNEFLRDQMMESLPWVPAKERSVEIFGHGHEKKLERLAEDSTWFGTGGLTLATFRCFRVPRQPVHALFPEARPGGIVISENEAGFHSLCRAATAGAGFNCIIFGDGSEVHRVIEFLRQKCQQLGQHEIHYIGDVDRKGLEIPTGLASRLSELSIAVIPWVVAYEALLADEPPAFEPLSARDRAFVEWLPFHLQSRAAGVLQSSGHRAQESFGWSAMAKLWGLSPAIGYDPWHQMV